MILKTGNLEKKYSAENLTPSVTYESKVEVQNRWDYSGYSNITGDNVYGYSNKLSILCAYRPTEPVAPVTWV